MSLEGKSLREREIENRRSVRNISQMRSKES